MRYCLLACLFLALSSCQVDYEDNERLLIAGSISDDNETPISDLTINIYAANVGGFIGSAEPIGSGLSLSDGSFSIVTLSPKAPSNLTVTVNEVSRSGHRPEYSSETINDVELLENTNYTYIIPKITVKDFSGTSLGMATFINAPNVTFKGLVDKKL